MTIDELIEKLEDAKKMLPAGGEAEVLLGHQPNYPLRSDLAGVAVLGQSKVCPDCEDRYMELVQEADYGSEAKRVWRCPGKECVSEVEEDDDLEPNKDNAVCWIVEGSQVYESPYAPRALWDEEAMV